ncbi:hypothetical protein INT43_005215 [Umbelopsis isabellina]|uniref:Carbohydrate esterase family 16 protein n=1 Tax=Mortierella isabellina TaxID=91625 RepID=A0A8H7U8U7_MORIS|nr:hypothetical protein INT43_005215 [Umbelopsis isabellina]
MKSLVSFFVAVACADVVSSVPMGKHHHGGFEWSKNEIVFGFGDSYTFTQGQYGLTNYSWNTFQNLDKHGQVIVKEDPIILNAVSVHNCSINDDEQITYEFKTSAGLPSKCKHSLYNIAFAGADIDPTKTTLHHNFSIDYVTQIDQWFKYVKPAVHYESSKTLAASFIGINDVSDTSKWTNVSFPDFFDGLIASVFDGLERLHGAGIESFLILNVPPVDKAPGGGGKPALTTNIATYNSILSNYTMTFAKNHTESNVFFVDTNMIFNSILANASSYGFKNTTGYCPEYDAPDFNTNYTAYGCLAPYEYFWYNTGHVTYPVHKLLADQISDMLNSGTTVNK